MTPFSCLSRRRPQTLSLSLSSAMILYAFGGGGGGGDVIFQLPVAEARRDAAATVALNANDHDHDHDHDRRRRRRRRVQTPSTPSASTSASSTSNSFCGPSWDTAVCSLDSHCETHSDCDANLGHFCQTNVPGCDVNDLLAEALLGPGSLAGGSDAEVDGGGQTDAAGGQTDVASDGASFIMTASTVAVASPTPPTSSNLEDHRFCGQDYTAAVAACSLETHCPNGTDVECPAGSYCYSFIDACDARDMTTTTTTTEEEEGSEGSFEDVNSTSAAEGNSTDSISMGPSSTTTATMAAWGSAEEEGEEEEVDWSSILDVNSTQSGPDVAEEEEEEEEEEDWSAVDASGSASDADTSNLWCGSSQFDATRNCGVGTPCPSGICPDGLSCFMTACVGSIDDGVDDGDDFDYGDTATTWSEGTTTATVGNGNVSVTTAIGYVTTNATDIGYATTTDIGIDMGNGTEIGTEIDMGNATTTAATGTATTGTGFGTGFGTTIATTIATTTAISTDDAPAISIPDDVTSTYYCGVDRDDAMTNCHQKCPSGNPGDCPSGMTCFGYTGCTAELGASIEEDFGGGSGGGGVPTPAPTLPPMESSLYTTIFPTMNRLFPSTPAATATTTAAATTSPPSATTEGQNATVVVDIDNANNNAGKQQNYCAYSHEELETACVTAPTCNELDPSCPEAMFCFGDYACPDGEGAPTPTTEPTAPLPAEGTPTEEQNDEGEGEDEDTVELNLLCFSSMDEESLKASCATAQSCSGGPCPSGMFCFPYNDCDADQEVNTEAPLNGESLTDEETSPTNDNSNYDGDDDDLCPANYVGWYARRECTEYYECNNGPAGPLLVCDPGLKFDILRAQCIAESYVDSNCLGPQDDVASDGSNNGNDIGLCPDGYVGWYARRDCTEYYECDNGPAGPLRVCDDGTRFDRRSSECIDASMVNPECIGSGVAQSQPAVCPEGYTGWQTDEECKEYFQCTNGSPGVVRVCMLGFKFDRVRGNCMDELTVNDFCYGPALPAGQNGQESQSQPQQQPQQQPSGVDSQELPPSCDVGYTGYIIRPTCREYYWCQNGVADVVNACGEDLLFDSQLQMCTFADQVACNPSVTASGGNAPSVPTPSPSLRAPSTATTAFPTFAKNPEPSSSKVWPTTASPSKVAENKAKQLPWLAITKSDIAGSGRARTSSVSVMSLFVFLVPLWLGHGWL